MLLDGLSHLISLVLGVLGHHRDIKLNTARSPARQHHLLRLPQQRARPRVAASAPSGHALGPASVFLRFPRYLANLPIVQAVIRSRIARAVGRYLLKPALIVGALWLLVLRLLPLPAGAIVAAALVVALEIALISPAGVLLEEIVVDWLARHIRTLSRSVLPGLIRLIDDVFNYLTDLVERAVYTVDEWLRFREGQSASSPRGQGACSASSGSSWSYRAADLRQPADRAADQPDQAFPGRHRLAQDHPPDVAPDHPRRSGWCSRRSSGDGGAGHRRAGAVAPPRRLRVPGLGAQGELEALSVDAGPRSFTRWRLATTARR